ncbi:MULTISPECIES: restriction endonuclease subunit S [Pseudomonadota]|uniref:restriction endonuclease subunit S n=1 Tax=Pseudomonadota TaxID=1224 RepID=UPI0025750B9F|nr:MULTISPECIES: restriction endonuclease subunit S [Pseudomonadota]MDM1716621.1 restriction endonuclease subunit S [Thiopseudomonas alkaliphila]
MTQAVPAGYKQTEVGVIPEDWELSNIASISATPMQNGLFFEPRRKGRGVPLINVSDMYNSAPINVSTLDLFDANLTEINTFKVKKGDLFFTRSSVVPSGIAFCNFFEDDKSNNVVFDSHLIKVSPNLNLVNPHFLYLNCISTTARKSLISKAKTATMTTIDQGAINSCPVLLPSLKEQTAIAQALSDVDALIEAEAQLIAKKQAIKTATMQQLLTGRTRLPDFAHHPDGRPKGYKPSELGEIPEDWEVSSLLDIASLIHGKAHEQYVVDTGIYVVVNSRFISTEGKVRKYCLKNDCSARKGDVLMVLSDLPNGRALAKCFYVDKNNTYAVNQRVCIFRSNTFDQKFLYLILNRHKYFLALDDGVTQTHILNGDISACQLFAPSCKKEQTAIATILSDMDAEIEALEQRLNKTRQLKQGMMQELLTGKTRLPLA